MGTDGEQTAIASVCPVCSAPGKNVRPATVRSLVKADRAGAVREDAYRFCGSPACDVVYFSQKDPTHRFIRSDLRMPVGQKEVEGSRQLCYCFDWTTDDIEVQMRLTGHTTIPARITRLVQLGFCRCETMNPEGSCCLGNVHRAVKAIRSKLAASLTADKLLNHLSSGLRTPPPSRPTSHAGQAQRRLAFLAASGAMFTAILGSGCCWLPLLLIAFGFSSFGLGTFIQQYRPYLLSGAYVLLALAWYFTYQIPLRRTWGRVRGNFWMSAPGENCCAKEPAASSTDACCSPLDQGTPATGPSVEREPRSPRAWRLSLRQFNQVVLWAATVGIVLVTFFPHWIGSVLRGSGSMTAAEGDQGSQTFLLHIRGMSCEGCAATIDAALRRVPGVRQVSVSFERGEAMVTVAEGSEVSGKAMLEAVRRAGYEASLKQ
jgi:copper chaperone CopZ